MESDPRWRLERGRGSKPTSSPRCVWKSPAYIRRINGTYVPTVVDDCPWAEGGLVFAKDNAPRPNDGDAEGTGMYLCEVTEQWVVCDLMNNSRTVYAKSVDFGKACAADVLEWMVHEGEGEAGWRRRQGFVMSRTKWSETEVKG